VGRYQKGQTNLDFTEARDSEWQWHQLGRMQVCTSLQTSNHASTSVTSPLSFLQAGYPSCCPTNSVNALKALISLFHKTEICIEPFRVINIYLLVISLNKLINDVLILLDCLAKQIS